MREKKLGIEFKFKNIDYINRDEVRKLCTEIQNVIGERAGKVIIKMEPDDT